MKPVQDTEVKIDTIKLSIAGLKLTLTIEQARLLKTLLEELFPSPKIIQSPPQIIREVEKHIDHWPQRYPSFPLAPSPWELPIVTCGTASESSVQSQLGGKP